MKGKFITFEGVEGCGKSTQSQLYRQYLEQQDIAVMHTREPGGPQISEAIREIVLSMDYSEMLPETEMLLYMAARSQHTGQWIIPALQAGKCVISDRYYDSTIAYQGSARQINRELIDTIREYATFGLKPDVTVLIDIPIELGLERISGRAIDRLESESVEFHKKVRKSFLQMANAEPERFIIIDGSQTVAQIQAEIIEKISNKMGYRDENK